MGAAGQQAQFSPGEVKEMLDRLPIEMVPTLSVPRVRRKTITGTPPMGVVAVCAVLAGFGVGVHFLAAGNSAPMLSRASLLITVPAAVVIVAVSSARWAFLSATRRPSLAAAVMPRRHTPLAAIRSYPEIPPMPVDPAVRDLAREVLGGYAGEDVAVAPPARRPLDPATVVSEDMVIRPPRRGLFGHRRPAALAAC